MTRVRYDRAALRLEMEGHACAGPAGADPVCAALSMLMMALERRMEEKVGRARPVMRRGAGSFLIECGPDPCDEPLCRESFDTVAAGLAVLAENRPDCVSLRLEGEDLEEEDYA